MTQKIFIRSQLNPILRPEGSEWWKVYNPGAVIDREGKIHLFPRVMKQEEDWHSRIAHAVSEDGEHFIWDRELVLTRQGKEELKGLEDPRVTLIGDIYFMTFAVYDGKHVMLHSATAPDVHGPWHRQGPMIPDFDFFKSGGRIVHWEHGKPVEKMESKRGTHWSKSGALFSERIDDMYTLTFGEFYIWLATSVDGVTYTVEKEPLLEPRKGTSYFDNTFIETGPPPIRTDKGWLMLYHGIDEKFRYQLGFVLLDLKDPRKILYRSPEPIFSPQEPYEIGNTRIDVMKGGIATMNQMNQEELKSFYQKAQEENIVPQVIFCPGVVLREGNLWIYYGAGDTRICTAWAPLKKILDIAS